MCCLVVQALVYGSRGFKKKTLEKKVARSTKTAKKIEVFYSKHAFLTSRF